MTETSGNGFKQMEAIVPVNEILRGILTYSCISPHSLKEETESVGNLLHRVFLNSRLQQD